MVHTIVDGTFRQTDLSTESEEYLPCQLPPRLYRRPKCMGAQLPTQFQGPSRTSVLTTHPDRWCFVKQPDKQKSASVYLSLGENGPSHQQT
jgi:hypothetical protein